MPVGEFTFTVLRTGTLHPQAFEALSSLGDTHSQFITPDAVLFEGDLGLRYLFLTHS